MPRTDPSPAELVELVDLAARLAREAGAIALAGRRSMPTGTQPSHDVKSSVVDPVTEFDRAAEQQIVAGLIAARPDDAIVGEEGADRTGTSGVEWHVDPIDGTVNFLYDLPGWSTSIAAVIDGQPVAAAVYAPVVDDLFTAGRGLGTRLNDRRVRVSSVEDLAMALTATGFSYETGEPRRLLARRVAGVLPHVRDIRRMGSAALDLAMVASARVDAYYEEHLNSWDMAAGALLVSEAGGAVTAYDGSPFDLRRTAGVVAAPPVLHGALLALLADVDGLARRTAAT